MSANAISLDAIAARPELARNLTETVRRELLWRHALVGVALEAGEKVGPRPLLAAASYPPPEQNSETENRELLDYKAAAKFLNCTVHWVRTHASEIGGVRIGRIWRFPLGKLRELVQARINQSLKR